MTYFVFTRYYKYFFLVLKHASNSLGTSKLLLFYLQTLTSYSSLSKIYTYSYLLRLKKTKEKISSELQKVLMREEAENEVVFEAMAND